MVTFISQIYRQYSPTQIIQYTGIRNRRIYGIGKHGIGEHGIGEYGIGEYGIGEHGMGEHGIGEYGIGEMLRHHLNILVSTASYISKYPTRCLTARAS